MAFPIFAFQITEGYSHTSNIKKYLLRLGIFALISQIPFALFMSNLTNVYYLNIFFALLLGLLAIIIYEKLDNKFIGIAICVLICALANFMKVDYGYWGIAIIFCFHIFKDKKLLMNTSFILLTIAKYLPDFIKYNFNYKYIGLFFATLVPLIFINLYNGKQDKKVKYFLYIYYPVHLLLLYSLRFYGII